MPTVPLLLFNEYVLSQNGSGFEGFMQTGVHALICGPHDTIYPITQWGAAADFNAAGFMSPSPASNTTILGTQFVMCAATYPDADDLPIRIEFSYRYPFPDTASWENFSGYRAVSAPTFKIKNVGANNEITMTWTSVETQIDAATYCPPLSVAEARVGATTTSLSVSSSSGSPGSFSADELGGGTHSIEFITHSYTGTLTLPNSANDIELRIGDGAGNFLKWFTPHIQPVPSFTLSEDTGVISVDASNTVFVYSAPHPTEAYRFQSTGIFDVTQAGPTYSIDVTDYREDGDSVTVKITAKSNFGCQSTTPNQTIVVHPFVALGTCHDAGNMAHSAVRDGTGTNFYRFPTAAASRELTATLAGVKPLSLWDKGAVLFFAGQETAGEFHIWKSLDFGRTWEKITMASIFNPTTFNRAYVTKLHGGGAGAVAVKKDTDPVEVYWKSAPDETTWPADAAAVLVGTLPDGSPKNVQILQGEGISVIVTNGFDWQRKSDGYPKDAADWSDY